MIQASRFVAFALAVSLAGCSKPSSSAATAVVEDRAAGDAKMSEYVLAGLQRLAAGDIAGAEAKANAATKLDIKITKAGAASCADLHAAISGIKGDWRSQASWLTQAIESEPTGTRYLRRAQANATGLKKPIAGMERQSVLGQVRFDIREAIRLDPSLADEAKKIELPADN